MTRVAVIGMLVLTLGLPYAAHAQVNELHIVPTRVDAAEPVTRGLQTNKSHSTTKLEGQGGQSLRITYGSSQMLEVYMVPLQADQTYDPTDYLHFTLPPGGENVAVVDLTPSPGWSPGITSYLTTLLAKDADVQVGFYKVEFLPASPLTVAVTMVQHLFIPESYAPNSYHALRGYRILGSQFTLWFGCLTMLVAAIGLIRRRKTDGVRTAIGLLVCFSLLYGARFALDLAQFSMQHMSEYYGQGTYDEAGSMQEIAGTVKKQVGTQAVYMCRDGTNFREKLLRYFAYPVPVSDSPAMASGSTLILLDGKINSSFTGGKLDCGGAHTQAELLRTFQDGSTLFRRLPLQR